MLPFSQYYRTARYPLSQPYSQVVKFRVCLFHKIYYNNPILKKFIECPTSISQRHKHHHKGILQCHTTTFHVIFACYLNALKSFTILYLLP